MRARLADLLRDEQPLLAAGRFERLLEELTHEVAGLGALEPLLADPTITEVMINGPGRAYVERRGRLEPVVLGLDAAAIVHLVERVVAPLGLRLDRSSPMVDARLPDGSRLHAVIPPLAVDGPCVTIRRFGARAVELREFGLGGAAAAFLAWAVGAGWNVLVAGATSAGKTTLLNALSRWIPHAERVVTIEETAELRLAQPHTVRLEARPPNAEGVGGVTVRELVRAALRMRPDRLVVGEVRSGEALDMLQALNTGHDGSMSTIHANGTADALARLETLVLLADSGLPLAAVARAGHRQCRRGRVRGASCGGNAPGRGHRRGRRARHRRRPPGVRPARRSTRRGRSPGAVRPSPGRAAPRRTLVRMLTLLLGVAGPLVCAALITAGRRAAAADRVRALGPPRRWRVPGRWRAPLERALLDADVALEPESAVECWTIAVAGVGLLFAAVAPGMAVPAALAVVVAGPVGLRLARSRRERRFAVGLPAALEQVAAELRGGGTVAAAVERLSESGGAVAVDFRRVHVRTRLGLPLADALAGWPPEHDVPGVRAAAGALSVAAALGGPAAEAIDGLAASLRHRLDAAAEAHSLSAQARLSAVVVGAAPLGYLAFSSLVDPGSVTVLVSTGVGRVCLVVGLGLEVLAALWIRRIVRSAG